MLGGDADTPQEAVGSMDVLTRDAFINPWRVEPTRPQVLYAIGLCRSELPYAERVETIASFPALDAQEMSELIDRLAEVRAARLKRLRRSRR
jgi:hypothetical protein